MNRLVYLFEMDSVRNYENTLAKNVLYTPAVESLFSEIIKKGNSVAITMNQLTDSQLIREVIGDDKAYYCLLELFKLGVLRVSLYGKVRTASQYIQQAVQKCLDNNNDSFVFSNLPIKSDDKILLQKVKNALMFSDLSQLQDEIKNTSCESKERMKAIYRFVNMILQLSICETSNIPPKTESKRGFDDFLEIILRKLSSHRFDNDEIDDKLNCALRIIAERGKNITDGRDNRSNWLDKTAVPDSAEYFANEIINICYNYTLEDSISGVSKHYDDNDFENSFGRDLINRVQLYCVKRDENRKMRTVSHSEWRTAVRFAEYRANISTDLDNSVQIKVYEDDFYKEKICWTVFMLKKNFVALLLALMYITLFCAVEMGTSWVEDSFSVSLDNIFVSSILCVVIFGLFGSLIGVALKVINRGNNVPDILESIIDIVIHFCDFWRTLGGLNDSYRLY